MSDFPPASGSSSSSDETESIDEKLENITNQMVALQDHNREIIANLKAILLGIEIIADQEQGTLYEDT